MLEEYAVHAAQLDWVWGSFIYGLFPERKPFSSRNGMRARCTAALGKMQCMLWEDVVYCGESLDVMREVADVLPCLRRTQQSVASQVSGKASIPEVAFS